MTESTVRSKANKKGRGISYGHNSRPMDEDALPSFVDPEFDDLDGALLDIREEFEHFEADD